MNTSSKIKKVKKSKNQGFSLRIFSLLIFIAAIIVSVIFSAKYVENNSKLSIEFAGGYETQVQYEGKGSQQDVINLLKNRVDPLGTSNVNIENITSGNGNRYNLALSKDAGVDISAFVHNVSRSGYFYLLDGKGNDLLATTQKDAKEGTWTQRDKRLLAKDVFGKIEAINNQNTHRPELKFEVKNQEVIKSLSDNAGKDKFYIYSDIGQLLDYIRSSIEGIRALGQIINDVEDANIKKQLITLLDNDTPGLGPSGSEILALANGTDPKLVNLLNPESNGQFGISWKYSDNLGSLHKLSVDTNDENSTYDPANRFNPSETKNNPSPMNAWLPYIESLVKLKDVSSILQKDVIDYRYVPYWVGNVTLSGSSIVINDDTFNLEKTEQIKSILQSGLSKNIFTLISYSTVNPTLGASSLIVVFIVIILAAIVLTIIMLFYYRILGVIVLMILALFFIFTIVTFTFINGIVAPESLIALIIGFALLLDTVINLLEHFKSEHHEHGKALLNAFKSANKKTLAANLDCSAIILIVGLTVFWFGTRAIKGFIIMTSIATFGVILFGIILLRLILWAVLKNNLLEDKPQLLGTKISFNKKVVLPMVHNNDEHRKVGVEEINKNKGLSKFKSSNWNFFHKTAKWIVTGSAVLLLASGITFAAAGANFGSGFDKRTDFIGMGKVYGDPKSPDYSVVEVATKAIDVIKPEIEKNAYFNKSFKNITFALIAGGLGNRYQFKIVIATTINSLSNEQNDFKSFLAKIISESPVITDNSDIQWNQVDAVVAKSGVELLINLIIAIALSFVVILIYIIIRFKLTYVLPLVLAIMFALIMTLAIISIIQIQISTSIVGILLGVMVLTIISVMAIFDNIREMKISNEKLEVITTNEIKQIANKSVQKVLTRTLFINSIVLIMSVITIFVVPGFWMISLAMFAGSIVSLVSSYFIAPWLWTFCERWRIKRYKKRLTKIKKNFSGADEYVIKGINE